MNRFLLALALCGLLAHGAQGTWLADLGLEHTEVDKDLQRQEWSNVFADETEDEGSWWTLTKDTMNQWSSAGKFFNWASKKVQIFLFGDIETTEARPQPPYLELCDPNKTFEYEARQYNRSVWVSIALENKFPDVAVLDARPKLLAYFAGANSRSVIMGATEPLRLRMPTPKGQWGPDIDDKLLVYSMFLPKEFQDDPPTPNDPDLFVTVEPPREFFAVKFSGYTFDFMNFQMLQRLEDRLNEQEERFDRGLYYVNVYNTSAELYDRRNEVMLAFNPLVKKPRCSGARFLPATRQLSAEQPGVGAPGKQPSYRQLCPAGGDYEARLYQRAVWVSTTVLSVSSDVGSWLAYPKLDKYFDGHNDQGIKIKKTLPVRVTQAWPVSVYDPVIYINFTYSYYLPAELYKTIPQPLDSDVFITDEPASVRFARRFGGYTYDFLNKQELIALENTLIQSGEQFLSFRPWATNEYYYMSQYKERANDITVYMDPLVKQPRCMGQAEFPPCLHRKKECPSYRTLRNLTDDIELRHVSRNRYVRQRTRTCNMSEAYDEAYMPLHRYFRGNNSRNLTIQRVPPVMLIHKATDDPPPGCDFTYNLLFYMPASLHHDPPTPTEDGVELIWLEPKETFVLTFEESTNDALVAAKADRLRAELDRHNYCYTEDEYAIATYDAPFRDRPHRHEIWITSSECANAISADAGPQYSVSVSRCYEGSLCPSYETANTYTTFTERIYESRDWVCKETTSCDVVSALESAITPLQEYYRSSYSDPPKSRPVTSFLSVADFVSAGCGKTIKTCMYMPRTSGRSLRAPTNGLNLETNLWKVAYVASVEGEATGASIKDSMTQLLQSILDGDLFHTGTVFVAWYDLPDEPSSSEGGVEVGALTNTLSYNV